MDERIQELLGAGLQPVAVAAAVGVTEGYISQLLADEEFKKGVTLRRIQNLESHTMRDAAYDSIEDELLDKLKAALPFMTKAGDILRAIQTINGAKRRGVPATSQTGLHQQNIVNINLPKAARVQFRMDMQSQVVEIDGRSLATMPANVAMNQLPDNVKQQLVENSNKYRTLEGLVTDGTPTPVAVGPRQTNSNSSDGGK